MHPTGDAILADLKRVDAERRARAADRALDATVVALKAYQHQRFEATYADLLADPRYTAAAHFFLDELYGPHDFTNRDAQFARVVPGLVRLFPREVVDTVAHLAALHALSEELDRAAYVEAWQRTGRPHDRQRQIELMHRVGLDLDVYTRNPLLRHSLRMMRGPARLARLDALQQFLHLPRAARCAAVPRADRAARDRARRPPVRRDRCRCGDSGRSARATTVARRAGSRRRSPPRGPYRRTTSCPCNQE